jgi:hypothetical protein
VKFDKEIWQGAGKIVDFDEPSRGIHGEDQPLH